MRELQTNKYLHGKQTIKPYVSALFLDLPKAFETFNHELLLAKLRAYGFSLNVPKLIHSYLSNRKQHFQINDKLRSGSTVIAGNLKGAIDRCFLFHLVINYIVFFIQYCNLSNILMITFFP